MVEFIRHLNGFIVNICQILAMLVIFTGISKSLIIYVKDAFLGKRSFEALQESRLEIGHSFSLGLAFLIGASILNTTLAPNWDDIGKLAAIIAIRTALNYFLTKEVEKVTTQSNN